MITYEIEENLNVEEFIQVLVNSTLGERRPIDERDRISKNASTRELNNHSKT